MQLLSPESAAAAKPAVDKAINPKKLFANYDSPANYDATPASAGTNATPPGAPTKPVETRGSKKRKAVEYSGTADLRIRGVGVTL